MMGQMTQWNHVMSLPMMWAAAGQKADSSWLQLAHIDTQQQIYKAAGISELSKEIGLEKLD